METSPRPRRQGIGLVFILLAVIAALAIGVVLLSQFGSRGPAETTIQPEGDNAMTTVTSSDPQSSASNAQMSESLETSTSVAIDEEDTDPPVMTFPPPPPPPIATPNSANLPPEG